MLDFKLAPVGSTGNNTHAAVTLPDRYDGLVMQMNVTAVGATPTITYKFQGSMDATTWFDVAYVTDANDTVAVATRSMTSVTSQIQFLSNPVARSYKYLRLVTSANTNVTYNADAFII